jgi:hypothetical protein
MSFHGSVVKGVVRWFARFVSSDLKQAIKNKLKAELKAELNEAIKPIISEAMRRQFGFVTALSAFKQHVQKEFGRALDEATQSALVEGLSNELRTLVRLAAGLPGVEPTAPTLSELIEEVAFLRLNQESLRPIFNLLVHNRVLFAGQAYYNAWYLSRALRNHGWKANVLNWDLNPKSQIYYHGEDFGFDGNSPTLTEQMLHFYVSSLYAYDVFHFSNAHAIAFGWPVQNIFEQLFSKHSEIKLLKELGKKIVYSNNGCLDGVSQSAFSMWGPESVCAICRWRNEPSVCSDERNLTWGQFRNSVADFQCTLGGNRADHNDDPRVHEVPEFYCLDKEIWHPNIAIPDAFRLPSKPKGTVWLYHAVGNKAERTAEDGVNIKSSHVYLPLISKLKEGGMLLELLEPTGIPNKEVRFLQAQADIFLEMLTYGWFGANAREAMMLGKTVVCYIRPEWLESVREEIPDYAEELPIISATPATIEGVLRDLIANPEKRLEIGQRSRAFAVKWHSAEAGGHRFDEIYSKLLRDDPLLRVTIKSEANHE